MELIFYTSDKLNYKILKKNFKNNLNTIILKFGTSLPFTRHLSLHTLTEFIKLIFRYNYFENIFIKNNIDLIYFTSLTNRAMFLDSINSFIYTAWDLGHLDCNVFPELKSQKVSIQKEKKKFQYILPKAFLIIVSDSYINKRKYLNFII